MEKKRTSELDEFKSARAAASLAANRKHRRLVKEKLAAVNNVKDEKLDEMLDLLRKIERRTDTEDRESDSETDSEEEVMTPKKSKKLKKLESDSEEEEVVMKKTKVDKRVPKRVPKSVPKSAPKKSDVLEPDVSDDLQLQRKFPLLFNYPAYV
jgi:hypothetical protein